MKATPLILCLLVLPIVMLAQQSGSESQMLQTFDKIIGLENTKLYNGSRYYNIYKATDDNHNFFSAPNFIKGNVEYDNATFYNVNLKYDTFNDELIFQPTGNKSFINVELIKDKVTSFTLLSHNFINSKDLKENNNIVSGYLQVIYNSQNLTLYAKRKKNVSERIRSNKLVYLFSNEPSYYLLYNDTLHDIKSNKSFRKIFPNLAKALKTEIKENKTRFEKDEEGLLLFLTQWIDFNIENKSTN